VVDAEAIATDAGAVATGAAARVSGKLCRKAAFSAEGAALATAVVEGTPPTAAIALRAACELAALA
jgi:hypothetical protein